MYRGQNQGIGEKGAELLGALVPVGTLEASAREGKLGTTLMGSFPLFTTIKTWACHPRAHSIHKNIYILYELFHINFRFNNQIYKFFKSKLAVSLC